MLLALVFVLLGVVIVTPVALSAQDLIGWAGAPTGLNLPHPWPVAVFVALDAAAAVCVLLTIYCAWRGEPAGVFGVLVWCFAAGSAFANWRHAHAPGAAPDAIWFFPAMSLAGPALLEAVLGRFRRWAQRDHGRRYTTPPSFGWRRWTPGLGALRDTYGAYRTALLVGIDTIDAAITTYHHLCPDGNLRIAATLRHYSNHRPQLEPQEPNATEPAQPQPPHTELPHPEPEQSEPAQPESPQPEPAQTEPAAPPVSSADAAASPSVPAPALQRPPNEPAESKTLPHAATWPLAARRAQDPPHDDPPATAPHTLDRLADTTGTVAGNGRPLQAPSTVPADLPAALIRRIPVRQEAYERWLSVWDDLRSDDANDLAALADRHGLSTRQIEYIRRAGQAHLLDSDLPPTLRDTAATPAATAPHGPASTGTDMTRTTI